MFTLTKDLNLPSKATAGSPDSRPDWQFGAELRPACVYLLAAWLTFIPELILPLKLRFASSPRRNGPMADVFLLQMSMYAVLELFASLQTLKICFYTHRPADRLARRAENSLQPTQVVRRIHAVFLLARECASKRRRRPIPH